MYHKLNAQLFPDALATSIVNRFNFTVRAHDLLVLSPRPAGLQIRPPATDLSITSQIAASMGQE